MKPGALLAVCLLAWTWAATNSSAQSQKVCLIEVEGAIGPATAGYIARAIDEAAAQEARCLIIRLDTPGGLLDSTKVIVISLLGSPVPVVVYVAPSGGGAVSAGCFITLAADVAAMAPATTIGAAHPVQIGAPGPGDSSPSTRPSAMQQKMENYAISYIETIAAKRKRNVEWAKSAVRESASITAEKALELNVVEIIADDVDDLLAQLDGREIDGRTLTTAGAEVVRIPMSLRERIFQTIWRPEVMFILMLIAIYGIIGELSNPGAIFPGVLGAIALILLLYMAAVLPINIAGLVLIGLAVVLFIAEVLTPTYGILTAGGIAAFFVGSLMLFDRPEPMFRLSIAFIIPATLLTAAFFVFVVGAGLRAQYLPVRAGAQMMLGVIVPALTRIDDRGGRVFIEGEYWNAVSDQPIEQGQPVAVVAMEGLTLKVQPSGAKGETHAPA